MLERLNKMTPEENMLMELLDKGAVRFNGFDESGEPLYQFTEKLKDVNPDLYALHNQMLNIEVMALWEKGFVDMDLFEDNPTVKISKKAFDFNEVNKLDDNLKSFLKEIKRIYREHC